jgi:hypothetical protein
VVAVDDVDVDVPCGKQGEPSYSYSSGYAMTLQPARSVLFNDETGFVKLMRQRSLLTETTASRFM